ncbi:MAG: PadR family transcriptional regulator [Actinobacteria bacterium]|jgi:DNA-binding PadR family transcriptional regulator|nr:PadR family transcriptional regulator [Actinomycetota bacterium]
MKFRSPRHPAQMQFHHPGHGHHDGAEGFPGGAGFPFPGPGFGPGFGPRGPRGGGRRGPGRGRAPRGDVRAAVLVLLAEEPMHGYQLMQAIADRSGGRWTPSPGAIYPAIAQLEDEGLVVVTAESGRKVASLTDAGREAVAAAETTDPFGSFDAEPTGPDLRSLVEGIAGATRQVARTGSSAQIEAAAAILAETRRSLYLLLADGPEASPAPAGTDG